MPDRLELLIRADALITAATALLSRVEGHEPASPDQKEAMKCYEIVRDMGRDAHDQAMKTPRKEVTV